MTIIAISSTKGGPGKTTVTGCLADHWAKSGKKVAVLDTDPNQNFTSWFNKRTGTAFDGVTLLKSEHEDNIVKEARGLANEHDVVIIDVAGVSSKSLLYAAGVASLVLIPAQPSEDDLIEAIKTNKVVTNAEEMLEREIRRRVVLTRVRPNTQVLVHSLQQLLTVKLPTFNTTIADRTIYQKSRFAGSTPIAAEPSGMAAYDIEQLALEIEALLQPVKIAELSA